jgi:hypothetical protein
MLLVVSSGRRPGRLRCSAMHGEPALPVRPVRALDVAAVATRPPAAAADAAERVPGRVAHVSGRVVRSYVGSALAL